MVHESIYEPFLETFVRTAEALKIGNSLDPTTDMGPLANDRRLRRRRGPGVEAVAAGATPADGGQRMGNTELLLRTDGADRGAESARILHEEPFGPGGDPVALLRPRVMARANSTAFGLAATPSPAPGQRRLRPAPDRERHGGDQHPRARRRRRRSAGSRKAAMAARGGMEGIDAYLTTKVDGAHAGLTKREGVFPAWEEAPASGLKVLFGGFGPGALENSFTALRLNEVFLVDREVDLQLACRQIFLRRCLAPLTLKAGQMVAGDDAVVLRRVLLRDEGGQGLDHRVVVHGEEQRHRIALLAGVHDASAGSP